MVFLMILFFMAVYIVLAVKFVQFVINNTNGMFIKLLVMAFAILLPTWDVILGYLVFYPACMCVPKAAVYEKAETEGIYYEGDFKNRLLIDTGQVVDADFDIKKGFKYMESLVTIKNNAIGSYRENIKPAIYRCFPDSKRPEAFPYSCAPASEIQSPYMVKVKKKKLGITEIRFMEIRDRLTGKLMGEYSDVVRWPYFPFFNWLKWTWWGGMGVSCPAKSQYYSFQYKVLIPKN